MKRLFLLIAVCMIGMVLPQGMWAETYSGNGVEIVVEGNTVTIKSTNAGALSTYLNTGNASAAIDAIQAANVEANGKVSSIVFDGTFKSDDLIALRDKSCCVQKTVDMSEAHFTNYTNVVFTPWASTLTIAKTSKYMKETDKVANNMFENCSSLTELTLGSGNFTGYVSVGGGLNSLTKVTIQKDVISLGNGMFMRAGTTGQDPNKVRNLKTVIFEEGCQIKTLPVSVFADTGIEALDVPSSVVEIESGAFGTCNNLKTVTIPSNTSLNYIRTNAFQGCDNIEEVHVNVSPTVHPICCEYLAFGEYSLVGQTQTPLNLQNVKMATLYFPKDDWDYYAGNWKLGMTCDDQAELNSIKDGCDPSKEGAERNKQSFRGDNNALNTSFKNQSLPNNERGWLEGKSPANGWQQFARTSTGIDIIVTTGEYFRTYSTGVAQERPEWMHIYRIIAFSDGFDLNNPDFNNRNSREQADKATKRATAKEIKSSDTGDNYLIPANTGVIRVDIVTKDALYYFKNWSGTYNKTEWEFGYNESGDKVNFMVPTNDAEATEFGPVDRNAEGEITHRNFVLTAQAVFLRAMPLTMTANRAYLKLPADLFNWTNESNGSSQDATGDDATASQYSKISLFYDDVFEEVNGGITTEIKEAIEAEMYKNDSFYTLQGVKVAKPTTKGVYIRNGKKIYIK